MTSPRTFTLLLAMTPGDPAITLLGPKNATPEAIAEIRAAADREAKTEPCFTVEVRDHAGELIAEVEKILYVRRKTEKSADGESAR